MGQAAAVERTLLGKRHSHPSLGRDDKLQAEQPSGDDGGCGGGRNVSGRLPRSQALERDASKHHRSRRAALPQGAGHGSKAVLHRPRSDGEPLGSARPCPGSTGSRVLPKGWWRSTWCSTGSIARARSPLGPTAVTMPLTSSRSCVLSTSGRMWRRIPAVAVRQSTSARRGTPATMPVYASASASRRPLAGSRAWADCAKPSSGAWPRWISASTSAAAAYDSVLLPKSIEVMT